MRSPILFTAWVMILLGGCTHNRSVSPKATVWVCTEEDHDFLSTKHVQVETVEPEHAVQRLLSGERPDAVIHMNETSIVHVRFLFEYAESHQKQKPKDQWRMQVSRNALGNDSERAVRNWAATLSNVSIWEEDPPSPEQLAEQKILRRLEGVTIQSRSYRKADLDDIVADLNLLAREAGLGEDPLFHYEPFPSSHTPPPITLEMRGVSFLEFFETVVEMSDHYYEIRGGKVVLLRGSTDEDEKTFEFYWVNQERWKDWIEVTWNQMREQREKAPGPKPIKSANDQEPDAAWMMRRCGLYSVAYAGYEEEIHQFMVVLQKNHIQKLEEFLYHVHQGTAWTEIPGYKPLTQSSEPIDFFPFLKSPDRNESP